MTQWDGKSKGTVLGYRIFVFCIKNFGLYTAYSVLVFVAFYYFIAYPKSFTSIFYYFRHRQHFSFLKSIGAVYKSYFVFGQVLIDKTAIASGLQHKFTFEFDGIENLRSLMQQKKGGILLSAHVGNFDIAGSFLQSIDEHYKINMVTSDLEHKAIKNYMESLGQKNTTSFIVVQEDMSHVYDIHNALNQNEIICFTGDRYLEGNKTLEGTLLGQKTNFPAGPYAIASRLQVPVIFVYVMKEPGLHYHLYARKCPDFKARDAQALLNHYTDSVEMILKKYPYQWFNFYDFWHAFPKK